MNYQQTFQLTGLEKAKLDYFFVENNVDSKKEKLLNSIDFLK